LYRRGVDVRRLVFGGADGGVGDLGHAEQGDREPYAVLSPDQARAKVRRNSISPLSSVVTAPKLGLGMS
jgi:hypothetical protein